MKKVIFEIDAYATYELNLRNCGETKRLKLTAVLQNV